MTNAIKVSKADKSIKAIISATFPEWRGRKVRIQPATSYRVENFWDGGSRCYVKAYSLDTGKAADAAPETSNPMRNEAHTTVEIHVGVALVEHQIFCGQDAGITIYVNPASLAPLLPAKAA